MNCLLCMIKSVLKVTKCVNAKPAQLKITKKSEPVKITVSTAM